jgi:hypothetical protein
LGGRTAAAPAFNGNDLVVQSTQVHTVRRPRRYVVREGDRAAGAWRVPDGDVLLEGRRALDRGLVGLLVLPDGVRAPVAGESTLLRAARGYALVGFHHVVLDERVGAPAVEGEAAESAVDVEGTAVGDGTAIRLAKGKIKQFS